MRPRRCPPRLVWLLAGALGVYGCGDQPVSRTSPDAPTAEPLPPLSGRLPVPAAASTQLTPPIETPEGCVPLAERVTDAGEAFAPDGSAESAVGSCLATLHRGVASREMRLRATLRTAVPDSEVVLLRFEAPGLNAGLTAPAGRRYVRDGQAVLDWIPPRTGEYGLVVDAKPSAPAARYALTVDCLEGCDAAMTRFPIVLMHGMGGTDAFLDVLEYFNGVRGAMQEAGLDVHVTVVDPLASSHVRAEQLVPQLEAIRADTGARRLNLIGHSQGGIDGRTVIVEQGYGDRTASLTTIATPHRGTPLADILSGVVDSSDLSQDLADAVGDVYGQILGRDDQNLPQSLSELGEVFIDGTFNPAHPDDPRVAYVSWAGHTCGVVDPDCQRDWNGEVCTPFLLPTFRALQALGLPVNDGLVDLESAQWGEFLGELPADHLDQVGLLGIPLAFDHVAFFLAEGDRLFEAGF